jgi:hypothetical protein
MDAISTYIPQDRRQALAAGSPLPERATGAALFAGISGFTPLTEGITNRCSQRRSFLENVPSHRGLVAVWELRGVR